MTPSAQQQTFEFTNPEYQADGTFETHTYKYEGSTEGGWKIVRNGDVQMELGPGFTPITTKYCGVCSTDLARRFLPYPLPQIIGHEVVGLQSKQNGDDEKPVVVEINASEYARNYSNTDEKNPYYHELMHTHDPKRCTLGIDRLPGGFAPVVLAPVQAVIDVPPSVSLETAALTEPFAAALQGVLATSPQTGDKVAVLGPRRLGALILAALNGYRQSNSLEFEIIALSRHDRLLELSQTLGADTIVNTTKTKVPSQSYDIVFDTTGQPDGFATAIDFAKRVVHLKSTNGQKVQGLQHLTDLVVDEMALLPFSKEQLNFTWSTLEATPRSNPNIFCAPGVSQEIVETIQSTGRSVVQEDISKTFDQMIAQGPLAHAGDMLEGSPFPRFDLAVASSLAEVDAILRPAPPKEISLVRARGAILLVQGEDDSSSLLYQSITSRQLQLHSSRCGNFQKALQILDENPSIATTLQETMISHKYPLEKIATAFDVAADSQQSIKVLVETND